MRLRPRILPQRDPEESRLRVGDLVTESIAGMLQRPARTGLTVVGIVLGIGAFVTVLGLTATATGQISKRFTEVSATEVLVEDVTTADENAERTAFPEDADARVRNIDGVRYSGVYWTVPQRIVGGVTGIPLPGAAVDNHIPVIAASPGLFDAVRARIGLGRAFDAALDGRRERVVVLGGAIASSLGVGRLDVQPVVFVNGAPLLVIGIVDAVDRRSELLAAVWIPLHTAEALWPGSSVSGQPPRMVIDTRLGAAKVVADQVAVALRPDAPQSFKAMAPPDPRQLRDSIGTDLSALFLALAAICLVIGAVGIANTTLVAVMERVPEIGLRRSLGAQRRHIAAQFLSESASLGAVGGLVAAGLGVAVVVGVAIGQQWTPVIAPWTVLAAPVLGALTGLISGLYPAVRAARIQPVEALRQ